MTFKPPSMPGFGAEAMRNRINPNLGEILARAAVAEAVAVVRLEAAVVAQVAAEGILADRVVGAREAEEAGEAVARLLTAHVA